MPPAIQSGMLVREFGATFDVADVVRIREACRCDPNSHESGDETGSERPRFGCRDATRSIRTCRKGDTREFRVPRVLAGGLRVRT